MGWGSLFLSAKGRIGRGDFWVAWFLLLIGSAILRMLGPAGALLSLAVAYPQICLFSKRLHDVGKSGWFGLWVYGAAAIAAAAAEVRAAIEAEPGTTPESHMGITLVLATVTVIGMIAAVGLFFRNALRRGEASDNAFGPPAAAMLTRFGARPA